MHASDPRYQRQVLLPQLGEAGQEKLFAAKVMVMGAGGLGCPCLQYLVAAGIGTIGIVDGDVVSLSNLHRQVLFTHNDIGLNKAAIAAEKLSQLNPGVTINTYPEYCTADNIATLIVEYDIIVDCSDNFGTRYLVNDACVLLNKPLVYGAVQQFEGQVAIFNADKHSAQYRDLFPEIENPGAIQNCAEAGVLGVLPGIIGSMQATEVIKLVTGIGKPLINRLLTYNALNNSFYELEVEPTAASGKLVPSSIEALQKKDYNIECAASTVVEINREQLVALLKTQVVKVFDVREFDEMPVLDDLEHEQMPLSAFEPSRINSSGKTIVFVCQSGSRSLKAASIMAGHLPGATILSLRGGVLAWQRFAGVSANEK